MTNYRAPGVYVEEISTFPPSVAAVETAIPAFIGYTVRRPERPEAPGLPQPNEHERPPHPVKIGSLLEFEELFGRGFPPAINEVILDENGQFVRADLSQTYFLYEAVQLFYANGGGDCYIVSLGQIFTDGTRPTITNTDFADPGGPGGIDVLETWDEPTILCFPDAVSLPDTPPHQMYAVQDAALLHCQEQMDRVAILDLPADAVDGDDFRNNTGIVGLSYGAAYTPWIHAALSKPYNAQNLHNGVAGAVFTSAGVSQSLDATLNADEAALLATAVAATGTDIPIEEAALFNASATYRSILRGLNATEIPVPPSGAVAGLYALTDRTRGVWKAPANVSVAEARDISETFTQSELGDLNIDAASGKSINAIRFFTGRGILVYGARTLAGNDGEYKYISVRRLMNMIEESIQKATQQFVFEPNDANTWTRVKAMIENFLALLWRDGALQGAKQEHAFRVAVGLGQTMSPQDVIDGRMIVEIAVAPVRPAEFILLRFMQHLPVS